MLARTGLKRSQFTSTSLTVKKKVKLAKEEIFGEESHGGSEGEDKKKESIKPKKLLSERNWKILVAIFGTLIAVGFTLAANTVLDILFR